MPLRVIGVGNPSRGDDAAGWMVADLLADAFETTKTTGEPAGLIESWMGHRDVVLVDATCCARAAGAITIVDLTTQSLPYGAVRSCHALGPLDAVELSRNLGTLPARLTLVGIEGRCFDDDAELSPEVFRAVNRAAEMIRQWGSRSDVADSG